MKTAKQRIEEATLPAFEKIMHMANTEDEHIARRCGDVVDKAAGVVKDYATRLRPAVNDGDLDTINEILKEMMG